MKSGRMPSDTTTTTCSAFPFGAEEAGLAEKRRTASKEQAKGERRFIYRLFATRFCVIVNQSCSMASQRDVKVFDAENRRRGVRQNSSQSPVGLGFSRLHP